MYNLHMSLLLLISYTAIVLAARQSKDNHIDNSDWVTYVRATCKEGKDDWTCYGNGYVDNTTSWIIDFNSQYIFSYNFFYNGLIILNRVTGYGNYLCGNRGLILYFTTKLGSSASINQNETIGLYIEPRRDIQSVDDGRHAINMNRAFRIFTNVLTENIPHENSRNIYYVGKLMQDMYNGKTFFLDSFRNDTILYKKFLKLVDQSMNYVIEQIRKGNITPDLGFIGATVAVYSKFNPYIGNVLKLFKAVFDRTKLILDSNFTLMLYKIRTVNTSTDIRIHYLKNLTQKIRGIGSKYKNLREAVDAFRSENKI